MASKEKDTPIKVIQQNLEKTADIFRKHKDHGNKSYISKLKKDDNQPLKNATRKIRLSEKGQRPVALFNMAAMMTDLHDANYGFGAKESDLNNGD